VSFTRALAQTALRSPAVSSVWSFCVDDLEAVERELLDALQLGDASVSATLLRDEFLITTTDWLPEPVGRQAWLEAVTGRMTLEEFDLRVIAKRKYGDVAVVLAESRQKGTHDGAPFAMTFRYTDVLVLEDERWRLAARHASGRPSQ
jgi:ketosteroid isomerase-like protein